MVSEQAQYVIDLVKREHGAYSRVDLIRAIRAREIDMGRVDPGISQAEMYVDEAFRVVNTTERTKTPHHVRKMYYPK